VGLRTIVAFGFVALACAQDLPHAFPRAGAKQVLDNEWGTVWDVVWAPGETTPMHRHRFDYVGVELEDAQVGIVEVDGRRRTFSLKRGESYFLPRGTTHQEVGVSDNPQRHALIIDLKDAPAPVFPNPSGLPDAFTSRGSKKLLENQRVVMWDYTWPSGDRAKRYLYTRNAFIVFLNQGELTSSDGRYSMFASGQVVFREGGRAVMEASGSVRVRGIVIELKR
jgi:quercetin dioxygenase-like cupin family protein